MVICSCNRICDAKVKKALTSLRVKNVERITPGAIYRELGCRPDCGNCRSCMVQTIEEISARIDENEADKSLITSGQKLFSMDSRRRPNRLEFRP